MMAASFADKGYWVSPVLFPDTAELVAAFDAVVEGHGTPDGIDRFGSLTKVSNAWWAHPVIAKVVRDPRLGAIAAALLGVDELYLWADSLYYKAPHSHEQQSQIGWHQDKQYWGVSSTTDMITACIALYPAGPESGGLRFAEGSHQWGLVGGSEAFVGQENRGAHDRPHVDHRWEEVCPLLEPGQVTFHHCLTFHGSGPNRTMTPRRSITVHMVSGAGRLSHLSGIPYLDAVGIGNLFRGGRFPKLYPQ